MPVSNSGRNDPGRKRKRAGLPDSAATFGGGWNVYGPGGQLQQTIQRQPFGNGYDAYGPSHQPLYQIRQQPFGGGYDVHTMPQTYHW